MMLTTAPVSFYHLTQLYSALFIPCFVVLPVSILDARFLGLSPAILLLGCLSHTTILGS